MFLRVGFVFRLVSDMIWVSLFLGIRLMMNYWGDFGFDFGLKYFVLGLN